jgi:hypothetical protein
MAKRFNPTRRGNITINRCLCGWNRKKREWVRNGCPIHTAQARGNMTREEAQQLTAGDKLKWAEDGKTWEVVEVRDDGVITREVGETRTQFDPWVILKGAVKQ